MNTSAIVQKLWNYCNVLRDDGMSYGDLEQSSQGWHEGQNDPWPYINYVLFIPTS